MSKKVLIIEKDRDILEVVSYVLTDAGYAVSPFETKNVTIKDIVIEKPDLIVLDVISVSVEGTALCQEIKAHCALKTIPIVALSTHIKTQAIKNICADEVMKKPFDIDELLQVIEMHIEAHA